MRRAATILMALCLAVAALAIMVGLDAAANGRWLLGAWSAFLVGVNIGLFFVNRRIRKSL